MMERLEGRAMLSVAIPDATVTPLANARPRVTTLTASPSPVSKGTRMTLTAGGVSDANGTVTGVEFWRDRNGNGVFEKKLDQFLGADSSARKGWKASVDTAGLALGKYTFFARARDNAGAVSAPAATQCRVRAPFSLLGRWTGTATFTRGDHGTSPLKMNVTRQPNQTSFSGTMTQLDTFSFAAVIGRDDTFTMTFSNGTSGTATGTLNVKQLTMTGAFTVKTGDGTFGGTFSLKKV
jgi:hypothetical protein